MFPTILSLLTNKITYFVLVAGLISGYYFYSSHTIKSLSAEKNSLQAQVTEITERQNKLISDVKRAATAQDNILKEKKDLAEKYNKLQEVLYRENYNKLSLEKIAVAKPKLVEKKINDATKNVLDCLKKIASDPNENC